MLHLLAINLFPIGPGQLSTGEKMTVYGKYAQMLSVHK